MIQRIRARPLPQEVADQIREMIRKGHLEQGQRISEVEFCEELGISRTPLREALRVLAGEGLVDLVPRRGARVSQPTIGEIQDMFAVMAVLEGLCARVAAEQLSAAHLAELEGLHLALEDAYRERDEEQYIQANHAYHGFVQSLAHNETLNGIVNGLRQKIFLYRYRQLYQPDRFDQSIREHRALLEAFRNRDRDRAEDLMKTHLQRQCDALVALYGSGPEAAAGTAPSPFTPAPIQP
ncbi:MAG: GntR family transcriptional regulator [Proteobacteria bacterium]|nr:GntR family transcriptional regulator [Pseudomonadota bacterium]